MLAVHLQARGCDGLCDAVEPVTNYEKYIGIDYT